ncbi:MAG TPA: efflux RND transporter periplasmic adaptor subunit [Rhizomicrobium sp.]|nr:efflux RND transporter periplasmic adaptor subunit [Rhizomicrobium sp.]
MALVVGAGALVAVGAAGGYWLHTDESGAQKPGDPVAREMPASKPLYYQDPDGKSDYSPTPKTTADGRAYQPVYGEQEMAAPIQSAPKNSGRILYYRHPMGLPDTSPVPKKDSMGMDYIPVREGEDETGIVTVSPARMQMLGVRTAPVELRTSLARTVRATGTIQPDESRLAVVTTKFDGVVEKLLVSTTGAPIRAGQPLARVWIQTPDTLTQMGPDVITRQIGLVIALQEKDPSAIATAENVLREYGMPETAIAEIRRTGRATRSIVITAPRSGIIIEKPAIEGMRFNTGDPLFKIADLSSVWLMADVQEQDLGAVRTGAPARARLVAYPDRIFAGKVDFIYPSLMASTRTGRARIVLPNPNGALRESMYASVAIDTPQSVGGTMLAVPDSAVLDSGTRQAVLVVRGQGRFEPRAVQVGARGDGYVQILDGLKPKESVVVSANFLIDAESNLRAALSAFHGGKP